MTLNQLMRYGRGQKKRAASAPALTHCPQKSGICIKITIVAPKKPNSALRKVAKVKLTNGLIRNVYIPGIKHNLQEHARVLVRGGRVQDLCGIRMKIIRGVSGCEGVNGRMRGRSKYGVKLKG